MDCDELPRGDHFAVVRPQRPDGPRANDKLCRKTLIPLLARRAVRREPLYQAEPVNLFNTED